ncbi:MAG: hypothetical protein ACEQR8_11490, partial [Cypionkella sp.]
MNAPPTDFALAAQAVREPSALGAEWAALLEAGGAVAGLAGLAAEKIDARTRDFPALIARTGDWRLELARNQVADLSAMMRPGLAARHAVAGPGQAPPAPAQA